MKIIDLLVKISKGEEVPKEINYQGSSYYFDGRDYVLYRDEEINYLSDDSLTRYINSFMLNDEVEIIEEEKELNKLVKEHYGFTIEELDNDVAYWCFRCSELQQKNKELHNKIDKAIEYINEIELDNYDTYIANILLDRNSDLLEILKDGNVYE